ncbi:unnamed protein product [Toxocara canis]|uniref:Copine domain-containing protein n=1 Tax=Toxocara canis TaxID=6265 RepID=A0A183USY6_TOXCA|nr:unnamed protein product [Toxocara canis]
MKDPIGSLCSKLRLTLSAKSFTGNYNVNASFKGALRGDRYLECGRTETLLNCLNAEWSKTICVDYFFEEVQRIKFEVYDIDSSSSNLADHDFIGSAESTLAEIVGGPSCRRTFSLRGKNGGPSCGELTVLAEEAENDSKEAAVFALRAVSLDKKKFFGKSDPFLQIYRVNDDGSLVLFLSSDGTFLSCCLARLLEKRRRARGVVELSSLSANLAGSTFRCVLYLSIRALTKRVCSSQLVHRTEVISKTLNPEWKPFEVSMQQLCGPNRNRMLRFDCYNYGNSTATHPIHSLYKHISGFIINHTPPAQLKRIRGNRNFIGSCEIAFDKLVGKNDLEFPLINMKKKNKKKANYIDSGRLIFMSVTTHRNFSFLEFIAGGTQLDFSVAIDMTASNGNVTEPNSLHFIGGNQPNEYHIAIRSVADICQHYNNSKTFDAMGFGAKIPPQNFVNHCFPLNIGSSSFTVFGVAGLLEAYQRCLMSCILYGPTNFASVISEVSKKAASYPRDGSRYHILLIITDGCICDFDQTLSAIIAASYLPLSIIIVGVGGENFDNMNKLDSDDGLLTYQGRRAQRDIVQFVPLRQFLVGKGIASPSFEGTLAGAQLAKEVLAEIPDQLTQYMKLNNIEPRPSTNPFSQPSPPSQATLPTAAVGAMGMQDIRGWAVSQPSQPIGFVGGISQPGGGSAPYPTSTPAPYSSQGASGYGFSTTSSPQYPPAAQIPAPSAIGIYPGGGIPLSAPSSGVQASSIPAGIGFTVVSSNSRFGQPEPPPPYCAFDEGDAAFGLTRTGVTVGERSRTQPSAPPPP